MNSYIDIDQRIAIMDLATHASQFDNRRNPEEIYKSMVELIASPDQLKQGKTYKAIIKIED